MARPTTRRTDALSKRRIVDAAIEILDAKGEGALTFRALGTALATGPGAIYWHVAGKDGLLVAATDEVFARALPAEPGDEPRQAIRAIAGGIFDALDEHPWAGAQLHLQPWTSLGRILEAIGAQIQALGVPDRDLFVAASTMVTFILGAAGQNAANARFAPLGADRSTMLAAVTDEWTRNDEADYPFLHQVAAQMRDHDDREQFLSGIDLLLDGIGNVR